MKGFVKSSDAFRTISQLDIESFDLVIDSAEVEQSSVTILGEYAPSVLNRQWLLLDGRVWRIATASPQKGKTSIRLEPVDTFFNRDILLSATEASTIGGFIEDVIVAGWIEQTDLVYAAPYITIANSDNTPFEAPETDENGIFNLLDYIRYAKTAYNVTIRSSFSGDTLFLNITKESSVLHPLVVGDGHTQLISSDFSSSAIAKLTVFISSDTGQKDEDDNPIMSVVESIYYLDAEGNVTDTEPTARAIGEWGSVIISDEDDPQEAAEDAFSSNETSRKIEVYSDVQMAVGDTARLRINGEVVDASVTGVYTKSTDRRTRYKLGDMPTTLTEKVDRLSGGTTTIVKRSGGGGGGYVLTPQDKQDIADIVLSELPTWSGGNY